MLIIDGYYGNIWNLKNYDVIINKINSIRSSNINNTGHKYIDTAGGQFIGEPHESNKSKCRSSAAKSIATKSTTESCEQQCDRTKSTIGKHKNNTFKHEQMVFESGRCISDKSVFYRRNLSPIKMVHSIRITSNNSSSISNNSNSNNKQINKRSPYPEPIFKFQLPMAYSMQRICKISKSKEQVMLD